MHPFIPSSPPPPPQRSTASSSFLLFFSLPACLSLVLAFLQSKHHYSQLLMVYRSHRLCSFPPLIGSRGTERGSDCACSPAEDGLRAGDCFCKSCAWSPMGISVTCYRILHREAALWTQKQLPDSHQLVEGLAPQAPKCQSCSFLSSCKSGSGGGRINHPEFLLGQGFLPSSFCLLCPRRWAQFYVHFLKWQQRLNLTPVSPKTLKAGSNYRLYRPESQCPSAACTVAQPAQKEL